jgi:hypothetical protein
MILDMPAAVLQAVVVACASFKAFVATGRAYD